MLQYPAQFDRCYINALVFETVFSMFVHSLVLSTALCRRRELQSEHDNVKNCVLLQFWTSDEHEMTSG